MSFQSTLRSSTRQISRSFSTTRSNPKIYLQASSKEFNSRVLDASSPDRSKIILAKFTASWCPPCKVLKPILKKMQEEEGKQLTGKEVDVMEIDVDEQQELAAQFKVRAMPTVIAFQSGKPLKQFMGALPEPQIIDFIKSL